MPANKRQPALQAPASPASKASTAKYINKDGTKTITVPKSSASTPPPQPSPTTSLAPKVGASANGLVPASDGDPTAPTVNRKKQKRRAKAAAKAAAEAEAEAEAEAGPAMNGLPSPASSTSAPALQPPARSATPRKMPANRHRGASMGAVPPLPTNQNGDEWDDETESDEGFPLASYNSHAGLMRTNGATSQAKKSKKKKKRRGTQDEPATLESQPSGISREKIWNTSSSEERERIKQFWLGLGEDERKSLVKVEKDAVLRKMKEQQKHTCSCTVCGRKRTAIEEELEGLYDAYYEELESFANQPQNHPDGPPMLGNHRRLGQMAGLHPPRSMPTSYPNHHHHPSRGRIVEHVDNDDDEEEEDEVDEYSDEDDLEEVDEEEEPEEMPRDYANDFFNFGNSLTVQGGILTVADDLLKNDGKKFIEMMEQLAERRMAREEDTRDHYASGYGHSVNGALPNSHNHAPPDEEEYDEEEEEEEEEEYDSQDEEYDEEEDTMTEEQRMEEGRRMFQIFAARMFEQRVLIAYREKVAKERQDKLLEELEDESRIESQRKAKKAKEAQKRKDKAAQKKQALAEEKARKDSEKAAEEAQRLVEEQQRLEDAKAKAEERKRKKELQKKVEEDDRLKKEADRLRRVHDQKEKQAEQERKLREAKEREKKAKEEQRIKEKELRELKEKETRERREKHEKDKREKDQRAAQAKADRDAKEKQKQDEKAAQKAASLVAPIPIPAQPAKKLQPQASASQQQVPASTVPAKTILPQHPAASHASPQVAVATPALPKAPTPMKPRSVSQEVTRSVSETSHSGSGPSQHASPHSATPSHASPGPIGPPGKPTSTGPANIHLVMPNSPHHGAIKNPPGFAPPPFSMGAPPMAMQYSPGVPPGLMGGPGFNPMHNPLFPNAGHNFRPPGGMPMPPPGLGGPPGRVFPQHGPPGFHPGPDAMPGINTGFAIPSDILPPQPSNHSRQVSASFDPAVLDSKNAGASAHPISRPTPIGRPGSVVHGLHEQRQGDGRHGSEFDDMNSHLGSSALLDDSDEPLVDMGPLSHRRGTTAPGPRPPFGAPPPGPPPSAFIDSVFGGSPLGPGWGGPSIFAAPPPGFASSGWPPNPAFGGGPPPMRNAQPRSVAIRLMLCRACKELEIAAADPQGFIDLSTVKAHVDSINTADPISEKDLLDMCETEGNPQNGGGSFDILRDNVTISIRYDPAGHPAPRTIGAPGEIGSPVVGGGSFPSRS